MQLPPETLQFWENFGEAGGSLLDDFPAGLGSWNVHGGIGSCLLLLWSLGLLLISPGNKPILLQIPGKQSPGGPIAILIPPGNRDQSLPNLAKQNFQRIQINDELWNELKVIRPSN